MNNKTFDFFAFIHIIPPPEKEDMKISLIPLLFKKIILWLNMVKNIIKL